MADSTRAREAAVFVKMHGLVTKEDVARCIDVSIMYSELAQMPDPLESDLIHSLALKSLAARLEKLMQGPEVVCPWCADTGLVRYEGEEEDEPCGTLCKMPKERC